MFYMSQKLEPSISFYFLLVRATSCQHFILLLDLSEDTPFDTPLVQHCVERPGLFEVRPIVVRSCSWVDEAKTTSALELSFSLTQQHLFLLRDLLTIDAAWSTLICI